MSEKTQRDRKTLVPELLPAPAPGTILPPKERVAERARIFLQRFRGLGTTAGVAVISLQCSGYGVVDPLPPPPQQCTSSADPFSAIHATGFFLGPRNAGSPALILDLATTSYPAYVGFRIDAVRVTGGTLTGTENKSSTGAGGTTRFLVTIAPAAATSQLLVDVDFGCGSAVSTKHYRATYTQPPSPSDNLTVQEIPAAVDAGLSSQ